MDEPHFPAYVQQTVALTLKKRQIIFLHEVSTHKVFGVEEPIAARRGRVDLLPTYSPDFNPIEQPLARQRILT